MPLSSASERIAAIAFYMCEHEGRETFSPKDMEGWFTHASLPKPKLMPVAIFDAKRKNGGRQPRAASASPESADDRADNSSEYSANDRPARGFPSAAPAKAAGAIGGAELDRHGATGSGGELIGDQLTEGEPRENPACPNVAQTGKPGPAEIEEAKMRCPSGPIGIGRARDCRSRRSPCAAKKKPAEDGLHPAPATMLNTIVTQVQSNREMPEQSDESVQLLQSAAGGCQAALGELLDRNRERLRRMVRLRMDRRVRGRVDPSDVIQEAFIEAARRLNDYVRDPSVTFFVWLRYLTAQRLQTLHRHHLGTQARDARREVSLYDGGFPQAGSEVLTAHLMGQLTSPSTVAARAELRLRLLAALDALDPADREILALRHFEQLSNQEAAQVLGVSPTAACNRYVRALERFRPILSTFDSGFVELQA